MVYFFGGFSAETDLRKRKSPPVSLHIRDTCHGVFPRVFHSQAMAEDYSQIRDVPLLR